VVMMLICALWGSDRVSDRLLFLVGLIS